MKQINEALEIIFGGKSGGYYLAGLFFCGIAILLSWYLASTKRDKLSPNTPVKYNFWFLVWDNIKKGFVTLSLQFILFRVFDLSNVLAMIGVGFFLSFGLDKAIEWLMDKTNLLTFLERDRANSKFMKNENDR